MAVSSEHQTIAEVIREAPAIVLALLRAAGVDVPAGLEATGASGSFSIALDDFNADGAVVLRDERGAVERVVVVEVQRARSDDKRFTLPVYQAIARRRHRAPCEVLVLALDDGFANLLRHPIPLGGGSFFVATVVGRAELRALPQRVARVGPEMAFLRALVLGPEDASVVLEALGTFDDLPQERAMLYFDQILEALPDALRRDVERELMQQQGYEPKSEFLRNFIERRREEGHVEGHVKGLEQGLEQGREEGRDRLRSAIRSVLGAREIAMTAAHEQKLVACSDLDVLASWVERAARATSAADVFDRA
ncbi:MAG: hypothetical protein KF819_10815 [Labilithrix sp.]|nr:hypothetical protein [Labilithrix sp.]